MHILLIGHFGNKEELEFPLYLILIKIFFRTKVQTYFSKGKKCLWLKF